MKQIVIISDDRPGVIADLSRVLSEKGINIETINTDTGSARGDAVVILTTDNYDEALKALRDTPFTAISEDAFVIRLKNEPGSLAKIAGRFKDANINIRSMHIIKRTGDCSLVALVTEKTDQARELLKDVLVA